MSAYTEYLKALGRAEILNRLIAKEHNKECTKEFILSLGFTEEEYQQAPGSIINSMKEIPSDLEYVTKFTNDLSTIIYTHNGMDYELYQAMNSLKSSADDLRKMLSDEVGNEKCNSVLNKMNVYYYPETIKILKTFFDNFEEMKQITEKRQSIIDTCASIEKMLQKKKKEFFDSLNPIDFELEFMNSQLEDDCSDK